MIAFIIALACLLTAEAGAAETYQPYQLRVGFDGIYRTGSWTPLTLEFPAASKDIPQAVRVWVEDPDGQYVRSPAAPVEPGADGRPVARLTVRFGRPTARVLVELVSAAADAAGTGPPAAAVPAILDQAVAMRQSLPAPIPATETVMLVLGDLPAAERASRLLSRDDGTRPRVVAIKNAATGGGAGGAATLERRKMPNTRATCMPGEVTG